MAKWEVERFCTSLNRKGLPAGLRCDKLGEEFSRGVLETIPGEVLIRGLWIWKGMSTCRLHPQVWESVWTVIHLLSPSYLRLYSHFRYSPSMKSLGNKFMHLTNYSVNKKNAEYQANEDETACQGHKWYLDSVPVRWRPRGAQGYGVWEGFRVGWP